MRLITLNIWEGRRGPDVVRFLWKASANTDIFCLQEVFRPVASTELPAKTLSHDLAIDAFEDLRSTLGTFKGQFDAAMQGPDSREGRGGELALRGLALFHRRSANVVDAGRLFVFGEKIGDICDGIAARNMQYVSIREGERQFLICNFHGLHIPDNKRDSIHRTKQSQNIITFLEGRKQRREEVILCGDFNLDSNTVAIQMLEAFGLRNLNREVGFPPTRTCLRGSKPSDAPDYVLVSRGLVAESLEIMSAVVSDHAPLSLVFS